MQIFERDHLKYLMIMNSDPSDRFFIFVSAAVKALINEADTQRLPSVMMFEEMPHRTHE